MHTQHLKPFKRLLQLILIGAASILPVSQKNILESPDSPSVAVFVVVVVVVVVFVVVVVVVVFGRELLPGLCLVILLLLFPVTGRQLFGYYFSEVSHY